MSGGSKKLWQVKHPYYCAGGCYYTAEECGDNFDSWAAFLEVWGAEDLDYNLLFRWDWQEGSDHDLQPGQARVELHFYMQRQARPWTTRVMVTRADEPAVRAYLWERFKHMQKLWSPLSRGKQYE